MSAGTMEKGKKRQQQCNIVSSLHADGESAELVVVCKTFLELHSKTEMKHSPKQLK